MTALAKLANPYVLMGLIVAVLFGMYKWEGHKTKAARLEAEGLRKSLNMATVELQNAEATNEGEVRKRKAAEADAKDQAKIAADRAAAERLAWSRVNKLKKEIANVTENPPVPDSIELVLDRLRSAVPGPGRSPADRVDEDRGAGAPNPDRNEVPAATDATTETVIGEHTQR